MGQRCTGRVILPLLALTLALLFSGCPGVSTGTPTPILVSITEQDVVVEYGAAVTFNAVATGGSGTVTYQWYVDGVEETGQIAASFTISRSPSVATLYEVKVVVSDGGGSASATSHLTVTESHSYPGNGNTGFAGPIGECTLDISNTATTFEFVLTKGTSGDLNDLLVIFIDSASGGFADSSGFSDYGDPTRQGISGFDGTNRSSVTFGFQADYAIGFDAANGGLLYQLANGGVNSLTYIATLGGSGAATDATFSFSVSMSDIGMTSGDSFAFVATYLNPASVFRADEAIGDGIAPGNPGAPSSITFSGSRTFTSIP